MQISCRRFVIIPVYAFTVSLALISVAVAAPPYLQIFHLALIQAV